MALWFLLSLALALPVRAVLDLSSNSTVAVYWGQNSFRGSGNLAQQRLSYYCNDPDIDVLILAFLLRVVGTGGVPEIDFSTASDGCAFFPGTGLKHCPDIGDDITQCQKQGKTVLLSIGGATYTEGGFGSAAQASAAADLVWDTFGPVSTGPTINATGNASASASTSTTTSEKKVLRPFGNASVDGFDFDFEAPVANMAPFALRLRHLADTYPVVSPAPPPPSNKDKDKDKDRRKRIFLTAAPQCPFPDLADKDLLTPSNSVPLDAVWVQFYNNYCGANAFISPSDQGKQQGTQGNQGVNFDEWDTWAHKSFGQAKVYLGLPGNVGAAGSGYVDGGKLEGLVRYAQGFASFGGVMVWDVTQLYSNRPFYQELVEALGGKSSTTTSSTSTTTSTSGSTTTSGSSSSSVSTTFGSATPSTSTSRTSTTSTSSSTGTAHLTGMPSSLTQGPFLPTHITGCVPVTVTHTIVV